jgi:multiple antibiotic resistance protein
MDVVDVALQSALLALGVAVIFTIAGPALFQVYGINIDSFRVAGGLVVLLLGLSMARERRDHSGVPSDAVVSLIATPLLTGPATMSFLIIKAAELGVVPVLANVLVAFLLVGALFLAIAFLIPNINLEYVQFISRLLGLFLIGLGVEMMAAGAKALIASPIAPV